MKFIVTAFFTLILFIGLSQTPEDHFKYELVLEPVSIDGFNGLHSFAVGQTGSKYLLIGGRRDGIHARQPFAAFPANMNNDSIFVLDVESKKSYAVSLDALNVPLREQLQSSNMNFFQDGDELILTGGYAYSASFDDHITFPKITVINISELVQSIINETDITPYFKQIENENFAVCGAQLGKIGDQFILVGGHRFDGRYNPMGHPTYVQTYTNQIRRFGLDLSGDQPAVTDYSAFTDQVHLHRRDYNLIPQIFPDSSFGYTIFSGVFQLEADLPFLYPVHIHASEIEPKTTFNQYLSNYHSAKTSLYDSENNEMHNLFFGGISQYYYDENVLVEDQTVPFVSTISRVSLYGDGTMQEYKMNTEMPLFQGASAEFVFAQDVPLIFNEIIDLQLLSEDESIIGYIIGGIYSALKNPFDLNNISNTAADFTVYRVKLVRSQSSDIQALDGKNPVHISLFPNPGNGTFTVITELPEAMEANYFISNLQGQMIKSEYLGKLQQGKNKFSFEITPEENKSVLNFTLVLDNKFYISEKLIYNK